MQKEEGAIFVVDDDDIIRRTAGEILGFCGYKVLFATNGEEAIEIYKEKHGEISIVLLDITMPKKSGKECYIEMKKINENVKVLISSGYRKDEKIDELIKLGANGIIEKPYTLKSLSEKISAL